MFLIYLNMTEIFHLKLSKYLYLQIWTFSPKVEASSRKFAEVADLPALALQAREPGPGGEGSRVLRVFRRLLVLASTSHLCWNPCKDQMKIFIGKLNLPSNFSEISRKFRRSFPENAVLFVSLSSRSLKPFYVAKFRQKSIKIWTKKSSF